MVKIQIHRHKTKAFYMPVISQSIRDWKAAGTIPAKVRTIPKSEQNRTLCEIQKNQPEKSEKVKMKIHNLCNIYSKIQCVKFCVVQIYFLFFLLISCSFFIAFSFLLRCSLETFFLRMYLLVEVPILLSFHFFI